MYNTIKRIIEWTGKRKKGLYIGMVFSYFQTVFTAMPIMGVAYILKRIMMDQSGEKPITIQWVWYSTGFMIVMVLLRFAMTYFKAINQESIAYEVTAEERINIGEILKRVSLGFFQNKNVGELTAAITSDLSYLEMYSMKMIDIVVNAYIGVLVMVLFMIFYSLPIAIISVTGVLLSALSLKWMGYMSKKNSTVHAKSQEDMIGATIEYIRGISMVKAFKQEGVSIERIKRAYDDSKKINIKIQKNYVLPNCMHFMALRFASALIVASAAFSTLNGTMEIPTMIMFTLFSFVIFGHVETVDNAEHVLSMIGANMDKVDEIKRASFIDVDSENIILENHNIKFDHVSFGYENQNVLENVSFQIPEHTITAIVGPSGSGKTTICSLLTRFYDVNNGNITIGGINVKNMTCDSLLSNISMVFQKVYLFHDSILNNIRFGKQNATQEEVMKVAKRAKCHEFIMKLPDGYNTVVGEGGSTLSGGEKQRIAIARAMLKDASIIILDEATASIDPENEYEIQTAINELVKGKTIIIIAHRLATIESADQILVVNEGKIVQKGIHKELIEKEGVYKRFIDIRRAAEGWSM